MTLIDWDSVQAQRAPHIELAELRAWDYNRDEIGAFCAGYRIGRRQSRQMERELDILALPRILDAVKWADERGTPTWKVFSHSRNKAAANLSEKGKT